MLDQTGDEVITGRRAAIGTGSRTGASSATSARASASCTRASAACASCAPAGRRRRPDHLRPLLRLLRRPDREEAARPLPARQLRPLVRHRGLQPDLQVLPELGHLQGARLRPPSGRGLARGDRRGGGAQRLPLGGLHLQRPGDLPRVRGRRRPGLPRARASGTSRSPPATSRRRPGASSSRTWTRPTST